ncbi:phenylacetic acid degradation operon negative regulatory protein PaaX [Pseudoduganella albidiflava]|uniref:Phenylacetic acid degradation operon negative regulatory protein n=1 Tax=Pseudoduganella albidiflava TaxID=321983 RepID=A0A411WST9_9BURK|nr:phenylacetic acid degradation operon negative regulatory protein PaaX [Pseudoduganella albidiflava]QBH99711.1 phenylacetic acid degradation operon negative regulatory protein PaaX [Pseudoduganella albidiflava]GGY62495.1 phenylacetic acid degradation operon negative regulatory protein [Pseudoduganella albidiflava]
MNNDLNNWIDRFLAEEPPRSKSLVMTVFGDAIVPHGGLAWLGSLIDLLAPFGVNDRLLRTSVFRLAQEGWLVSQRDGRRSHYTITPAAAQRFARAFRRVYAAPHVHWHGSWTFVLGTNGLNTAERAALRKELLWEGYSVVAPGIAGHPAGDAEALDDLLGRLDMRGKVYVVQAAQLPGVQGKSLADLVAEGWDLRQVAAGYQRFIDRFAPLRTLLAGDVTPERAFVVRTLLIHAYRRVQLHDPQLPVELLPEPWPGAAAYELARELYLLTHAPAGEHVLEALRREQPDVADAGPVFFERFGGLRGPD